ncbi:protein FAR1-RELATED SEQUENCE 11 isoform X2 [Hordeum vulgare subsp. vulgare]|uniref:protein FAR1-RELATED SEQUENCE 11 isoform X2 n=1 Tax=Hordeum vulgare subsp. vulgare TaxID=112509 RepID=UPI001D1A445C|nr:protein FAR1-RELATED SEQUENCE 11 isoform X2 [Hordeum vulgare subsp. vulgare]
MERPNSGEEGEGDSPNETRISLETAAAEADDSVPYIGQRFLTHEAAYELYSGFAKQCGFSIRRHRTEGKDGVGKGLTRRYFVCHRAGNTPAKPFDDGAKQQRNRKSSRCGCQAYLRIGRDAGAGGLEWRVTGFSNHHNHELLRQDEVRFLPAYRVISDSDRDRILVFAKSGISVQQMMRIMELEKCVQPGTLPFTEKDVRNLIQSFRRFEHQEESVDLLQMCRNVKEKDPNFSCALLREENLQSFTWALQVFLNFMNRKAPQTILTDQNKYLKEAVQKELPNTKHAFSIGLLASRFPSWFSAVLGGHYNDWEVEFYRLYNMESTMDFDLGWSDMVSCYGLHGNRHIASLFASRNLWASPYLRGHFLAGLTALPGVSKIKDFIQRLLSTQICLSRFIEQVAIVVDYKDQAGEQQIAQQSLENTILKTAAPVEGHAAAVFTPYAFCKLQDELVGAAHYAYFHLEGNAYLVRHHTTTDGGCNVTWNQKEELISCSCQMFESSGILCRHALRLLTTLNYFQIPDHYVPVRWRRTQAQPSKSLISAPHYGRSYERVKELQSMVAVLVSEASQSEERMDLATQEVSVLLSRIKQQPVVANVSGDSVRRLW